MPILRRIGALFLIAGMFGIAGMAVAQGESADVPSQPGPSSVEVGGITVYTSGGDNPVYSLEPISREAATALSGAQAAAGDGRGVTPEALEACRDAESAGQVDPGCALMLAADRNGDVRVTK